MVVWIPKFLLIIPLSMHLFSKYLLFIFHMPNTVLVIKDKKGMGWTGVDWDYCV